MPGFDAVKEATKIEHLVKDFIGHQNDTNTPEASRQAMNADKKVLEKEMTDLWKTPGQIEKVTIELEKMSNATWSLQPNVAFDHDSDGNVTAMTFSPSKWTSEGWFKNDRENHEVIVKFDKDKEKAKLYETIRTIN